jgi:hypothetical protein
MNSSLKGAIAEQAVILECTRLRIDAMRPFVEGRRYDLMLDTGDRLLRAQCKWASLKNGVIVAQLGTCRHSPTAGYIRTTYTAAEIDGFALYCDATRDCFWLPIADFEGLSQAHLRVEPARNNQRQLVKWAADYPFGAVAQLGERVTGSHEVRGSSPLSSIDDEAA